jgi:hypothetical protein
VATIIYDNVSTAGIEIDIWDSCSGVYDNDDVGFSGGSHDDDEKFEEGESGQLAVQNPTRSKRVGYQIFSATVKRLFTLFDAHTNDNVLTPADFVSSAIAQRCATAINEEMKSDQVHLGSAVTLHKYADEVTAIRNHFRAKCKSWDLLDESVMMTEWHHGNYNKLEDGVRAEAEQMYHESMAIRKHVYGDNHPAVAESINNIALLHFLQGQYSEAKTLYEQCLAIKLAVFGSAHSAISSSYNNLAGTLHRLGKLEVALNLYNKALEIRKRVVDEKSTSGNAVTLEEDDEAKNILANITAVQSDISRCTTAKN